MSVSSYPMDHAELHHTLETVWRETNLPLARMGPEQRELLSAMLLRFHDYLVSAIERGKYDPEEQDSIPHAA